MMKQASILAAALLFSVQAGAATVTQTGTVELIRVHDSATFPTDGMDWMAVQGLPTTGHSCATNDGRVVLLIRDDQRGQRMMSLATSALLSGKNVRVSIDDTKKRSGSNFCFLQNIILLP